MAVKWPSGFVSGPGQGFLLFFNFQPASIQKKRTHVKELSMIIKNDLPFLDPDPHLDSYYFHFSTCINPKKRTHATEATYDNKKKNQRPQKCSGRIQIRKLYFFSSLKWLNWV